MLELSGQRIDFDNQAITFHTLKKRKLTKRGEIKAPVYRQVPVPPELLNALDLLYDLRNLKKQKSRKLTLPLWPHQTDPKKAMSRATGWRIIKKVLDAADIEGSQATAKGFRHGFGVAMVMGGMDLYTLQHILGHERPETAAIYLQVKGQEAHGLQMGYWNEANKGWGGKG